MPGIDACYDDLFCIDRQGACVPQTAEVAGKYIKSYKCIFYDDLVPDYKDIV